MVHAMFDSTGESATQGGMAQDEQKPNPASSDRSSSTATENRRIPSIEEPITTKYLEFNTRYHESPLPEPNASGESPPSAPNLNKYENPMDWSSSRKAFTTWLSCLTTVITSYTPGAYAVGVTQYTQEWEISRVAAFASLPAFTTFFGLAPLFLAPLSEIAGRRPVFVPSGIVYVAAQVLAGTTKTYAGMVVSRVLAGTSSSVFATIVSGVIADIYTKKDRNTPMTLFAGSTLFGTGLGPLISGLALQHLSWRWIWYIQIITCGTTLVAMVVLFKETRGSILLSRKARALNKWYDSVEAHTPGHVHHTVFEDEKPARIRWKVRDDEERASIWVMIRTSAYRPFHLLITESVVFWFSMWAAFSWIVLYMTFEALPFIFSTRHRFNYEQNGAVFSSICVGSILSVILGIWQGKFAVRSPRIPDTPEGGLYFACVQGALMPIGLFWLGWTSFSSVPWIVPVLAVGGPITMGIFSIYLAVFNYLTDTYHIYASSANAAQSFARNIVGGVAPLFVEQMYQRLTIQGASSLLGGLAVLLTIVPWILVAFGTTIRRRSKFATSNIEKS